MLYHWVQLNSHKAMSSIVTTTTSVYYGPLVRWEKVDELVFLTHPTEHTTTRELIITTLDYRVLEAALAHLAEEKHEELLHRVHGTYHDHSILDWLEEEVSDITSILTQAIRKTKDELRELLEDDDRKLS